MVATPADFHGTPWAPRSAAPKLGEHTEEILDELRAGSLARTGSRQPSFTDSSKSVTLSDHGIFRRRRIVHPSVSAAVRRSAPPRQTWSDRCYFFAASPDGTLLLASGYGNNPNTSSGLGYVKVTLADGRHWDLLAGRPVTGADRADLSAGPMRWTCVEPLKKWKLEVLPTSPESPGRSYYEPTAPMWELLPSRCAARTARCSPTCTT